MKLSPAGRMGCLALLAVLLIGGAAYLIVPRLLPQNSSQPTTDTAVPFGSAPTGQQPTTAAQRPPAQPTASNTGGPATTQPQPTAASQASQPTSAPVEGQASCGDLTVAMDAFGSYYTTLVVAQMPGKCYSLNIVPFLFDGTGGSLDFDEATRAEKMRTGEWDILLSTQDTMSRNPDIGKIVVVIDQSAGADKIVAKANKADGTAITKFNDLRGARIAFAEGSVGHYQVLALMRVVGLTTNDVQLVPKPSVADAVSAFVNNEVDAVAGWEPDISDAVASGGQVLVNSDWWRNIQDVIIVSHQANTEKREVVDEFVDNWFEALNIQQQNPAAAAQAVATWTYQGQPTNDWSFVYEETAAEDMQGWLETIAQAGIGANKVIMQNPQALADQLRAAREIWAWGGQVDLSQPFDPMSLIEPSYVLASDVAPAGGEFINPTFQAGTPSIQAGDPSQLISVPTVAELPCRQLAFLPDQANLTRDGLAELRNCSRAMIELLRTSNTATVLVTGSSAWPDGYAREAILEFALSRALTVKSVLAEAGVDPSRVVIRSVAPEQTTNDEASQAPHRYVLIEIKLGTGR